MPKYEFLIRPMSRVVGVERDGEGLDFGESVVSFEDHDFFVDLDGQIEPLEDAAHDSLDAYIGMDFPSDAHALAFVRAFDAMCLDPWRVDFAWRLVDDPDPHALNVEIYAYGDFDPPRVKI